MKYKTTISRSYLILGISFLSILITSQSCTTEYRADARYVYINDTDSVIEVKGKHPFVVKPQEEYVIEQKGEGSKHPTSNEYVSPYLDYAIVIFNNNKCDTLEYGGKPGKGEGILGMNNYTSEKLNDHYFKFTYHFTEEDFLDAVPCE